MPPVIRSLFSAAMRCCVCQETLRTGRVRVLVLPRIRKPTPLVHLHRPLPYHTTRISTFSSATMPSPPGHTIPHASLPSVQLLCHLPQAIPYHTHLYLQFSYYAISPRSEHTTRISTFSSATMPSPPGHTIPHASLPSVQLLCHLYLQTEFSYYAISPRSEHMFSSAIQFRSKHMFSSVQRVQFGRSARGDAEACCCHTPPYSQWRPLWYCLCMHGMDLVHDQPYYYMTLIEGKPLAASVAYT